MLLAGSPLTPVLVRLYNHAGPSSAPSRTRKVADLLKIILLSLELVLSLALIGAILLHSAKGEGLAGIGGQAHVFGSQKGVEAGLNRVTAGISVAWFTLAIVLAWLDRVH